MSCGSTAQSPGARPLIRPFASAIMAPVHPYVLYNGRITEANEAILRPGQLGLLAGWGVFTTLRIYQGVPFAYERHWERMKRDAELLHVPFELNREEVRRNLLALIDRNQSPEASMRVCVVRSEGGAWQGPGSGRAADLVAFSIDLHDWADRVSLDVRKQGRHAASPFAGTKSLSWAHNLTMIETAQRNGFDEVILLNERGQIAECTSANIFAVVDGVTYTPPLSAGPLPGVTRAVMLRELDLADTPVQERTLLLEDLYEAEEVFITSSTRELLPVERIRDRVLSQGPWPVMDKLRAGLRAYVERYVGEQRSAAAAE